MITASSLGSPHDCRTTPLPMVFATTGDFRLRFLLPDSSLDAACQTECRHRDPWPGSPASRFNLCPALRPPTPPVRRTPISFSEFDVGYTFCITGLYAGLADRWGDLVCL